MPNRARLQTHPCPARHTPGNTIGKHSGNDSGKNGNAARLQQLTHPTETATLSPEKFSPCRSQHNAATATATHPT